MPGQNPDSCPSIADPAGWFGLGGSGPADDGVRARAASSGGGLATTPGLGSAAVGFDGQERPVIAWVQDQAVFVRRRDARGWQPLGDLDHALGVRLVGASGRRGARLRDGFGVWSPAVAGVGREDVMVAWLDDAPPWLGSLRAARWSNGAWRDATPRRGPALMCRRWNVEFGASSEPPALHVDSAGRITAACVQPLAARRSMPRTMMWPSSGPVSTLVLQVWQWDGRRWHTLPPAPLDARGAMAAVAQGHGIALATDRAGAPVVLHGAGLHGGQAASAPTRWQRLHWQPRRRTWQRVEVTAPISATGSATGAATLLGLAPTPTQGLQPLWLQADALVIGAPAARIPAPPLLTGPRGSADPLPSFVLGAAASPTGRLAVATATRVAFERVPHTLHVHVWDGTAWSDPGATHGSGGVSRTPHTSRQPALALDPCRRPAVTWIEVHPGGSDVYLRRWTGHAWEALAGSAEGGGVSASGRALSASVAVDAGGAPVVLWWEQPAEMAPRPRVLLRARRFRDGRWADLGSPEMPEMIDGAQLLISDTKLQIDAGGALTAVVPVVASDGMLLLRWDGAGWARELRGDSGRSGSWRWPALDEGVLRAFWLEPDGSRLVAGVWRDGWQIERTLTHGAGPASEAAAARDAAGRVYLAWTGARTWPAALSLARADAGIDTLAPAPTTHPGSPGDSEAHAREPALAVGARVCVAWSDIGASGSEIYLRCHALEQPGQSR